MNLKNFISFEGIDGSGKSTQVSLLSDYLKKVGKNVVVYKEPGGTELGEKIREILLSSQYDIPSWSEVFLFLSSRKALMEYEIKPFLKRGYFVILDRFVDSTYAYQGYGHGLNIEYLENIHKYANIELLPQVTFLLDISVDEAFSRMKMRREKVTRIEGFSPDFFHKVRNGYISLFKKYPERIKIINAERSKEEIHKDIVNILEENGII